MTFLAAKKNRCGIRLGLARLRVEPLEDRRMLAADLGTVIDNLDFENYANLPTAYSGMSNLPTATTVEDWYQLSYATTDYLHMDSFTGHAWDAGLAPPPANGSKGFIGLLYTDDGAWSEYAMAVGSLSANTEYQLDLFVGTNSQGSIYGGAFEGDLIIYGIIDVAWTAYYTGSANEIEDFASAGYVHWQAPLNYVELASFEIDQAASTWDVIKNATFTPSVDVEAIAFGIRGTANGDYLLVDAAPVAPRVTQVTISGPNTLDGNRTTPNGSFDIPVGSGEQIKTVPIGGANEVSVQFNKGVTIASGDLDIVALNKVVNEPAVSSFDPPTSLNNYTATWIFAAALPAAQYLVSISDDVVDSFGIHLDGEWTNPGTISAIGTSTFPSGDGYAGGDFDFVFTILPGDTNRDSMVSFADYATLQNNYNQSDRSWAQGNFNGDGSVNFADYAMLQNFYNENWQALSILADVSGSDYSVDASDETSFLSLYGANNLSADLDKSGTITSADLDAFYEQFDFGIDLEIVV